MHGVLQSVPLDTGDGLDALAEAQAVAEDVPSRSDEIAAPVRAAIGSPTLRRVAAGLYLRETYVGTEIEGRLLKGDVDLLFRDDDGLVLVDY